MPGVYEKIDYRLRPAKHVERKMLAEVLARVFPYFGDASSYQYIGFGSIYFADFHLFHKTFGITNMVSIERDVDRSERFTFNLPFRCIDLHFGDSTEVLPTLPWNTRTIIWLDYEDPLDKNILSDISTVITKAQSGSILIVTMNAYPLFELHGNESPEELKEKSRRVIDKLRNKVGPERIAGDLVGKDLHQWGTARQYRRIIKNQIDEVLRDRNAGRLPGAKFLYKQLFNFHYADGGKMLTTGGILYDEGLSAQLSSCQFDRLPFVRNDDNAYEIHVPRLTFHELRYLDKQLPNIDDTPWKSCGIPEEDLRIYADVYRYFPMFAEMSVT